jgi:hypothetical protein
MLLSKNYSDSLTEPSVFRYLHDFNNPLVGIFSENNKNSFNMNRYNQCQLNTTIFIKRTILSNEDNHVAADIYLTIHITDTHRYVTPKNSFNVEVMFLTIVPYSETAQNVVYLPIRINFVPESLVVERPASCQRKNIRLLSTFMGILGY